MSEKPALRPDLAVGEALRDVAHDILSDARTAIESPDNSDAVAVHEFRREMKRWRALLRLLEPFLGEESEDLQTTARDLARDLGGARDPQSALDALDDLKEHDLPLSERSIKTVRKRIDDLRTAGEMSALTSDMRLRIAEALADADAAVNRWPLHDAELSGHRQATGGELSRGAARRAGDAGPTAGPEALHELRKLVVIHRYQMQIVEPLWQALHQDVDRRGAAAARAARPASGSRSPAQAHRTGHPLAHWRARLEPADRRTKAPPRRRREDGSQRGCSWTSPARSAAA